MFQIWLRSDINDITILVTDAGRTDGQRTRQSDFYRAMQYCIARYLDCMSSVRLSVLSVRLSVTLVNQDHISWKSWKLIARSISPTPSPFVAQRPSTYTPRETWGNLRERGGLLKSGVLEHKSGNISETRKDRGKVTIESLQEVTNALSNGAIPDPLRPPLPQDWGFATPPQNCNHYYLENG